MTCSDRDLVYGTEPPTKGVQFVNLYIADISALQNSDLEDIKNGRVGRGIVPAHNPTWLRRDGWASVHPACQMANKQAHTLMN